MFESLIWYHGRNENPEEHFYRDQSETSWPVTGLESEQGENGEVVVKLSSQNNDYNLQRTISMFPGSAVLRLLYTVTCRESRLVSQFNFPLLRFTKDVDSVSYNTNPEMTEFATSELPSEMQLSRSHLIFLHSSKNDRTIVVLPNLNLPLSDGESSGISATFSDGDWCKILNFKHLYHHPAPFYSAGKTQQAEIYFLLMPGGSLRDEHKKIAIKTAAAFQLAPPQFKLEGLAENQQQASELAGILAEESGLTIWNEVSLKRVHPETTQPSRRQKEVFLEAAANEAESSQIILDSREAISIEEVNCSALQSAQGHILPESCSTVEWLDLQEMNNVYTAYGMSAQIPDQLLPMKTPRQIHNTRQIIWFTVKVPAGTPAGDYQGHLTLAWRKQNGELQTSQVPIRLNVWNFTLPDNPAYTFYGLLWSTPAEMRRKTLEMAARYRLSVSVFPGSNAELRKAFDGQELKMPEFFDLSEYAVKQLHFNYLPLPYFFFGNWSYKPGEKIHFLNLDPQASDFEEILSAYLTSCRRQFQQRGIAEKAVAYMWDEITSPHYPMLKQTSELCRKIAPEMRILTVGAPDLPIIEHSDIIVGSEPYVWWGELAKERIRNGKKSGKEFWFYTNGFTFSPDNPSSVARITPWRSWTMGLTGYLQWSMDYNWKNGSFQKNASTLLFYPPLSGQEPVSSVRLALFRDGIDDFDLFDMAQKRLPPQQWQQLNQQIHDLASTDCQLNLAPEKMLEIRRQIAQALEGL